MDAPKLPEDGTQVTKNILTGQRGGKTFWNASCSNDAPLTMDLEENENTSSRDTY